MNGGMAKCRAGRVSTCVCVLQLGYAYKDTYLTSTMLNSGSSALVLSSWNEFERTGVTLIA